MKTCGYTCPELPVNTWVFRFRHEVYFQHVQNCQSTLGIFEFATKYFFDVQNCQWTLWVFRFRHATFRIVFFDIVTRYFFMSKTANEDLWFLIPPQGIFSCPKLPMKSFVFWFLHMVLFHVQNCQWRGFFIFISPQNIVTWRLRQQLPMKVFFDFATR